MDNKVVILFKSKYRKWLPEVNKDLSVTTHGILKNLIVRSLAPFENRDAYSTWSEMTCCFWTQALCVSLDNSSWRAWQDKPLEVFFWPDKSSSDLFKHLPIKLYTDLQICCFTYREYIWNWNNFLIFYLRRDFHTWFSNLVQRFHIVWAQMYNDSGRTWWAMTWRINCNNVLTSLFVETLYFSWQSIQMTVIRTVHHYNI